MSIFWSYARPKITSGALSLAWGLQEPKLNKLPGLYERDCT